MILVMTTPGSFVVMAVTTRRKVVHGDSLLHLYLDVELDVGEDVLGRIGVRAVASRGTPLQVILVVQAAFMGAAVKLRTHRSRDVASIIEFMRHYDVLDVVLGGGICVDNMSCGFRSDDEIPYLEGGLESFAT